MNYIEAKALSPFPLAFSHADTWVVRDETTGRTLESHSTKERAMSARDICNEQERKRNLPQRWIIEELDPIA